MREVIMKMLNDIVEGAVDMSISDEQTPENWGFKELNDLLLPIIPLKPIELTDEIRKMNKERGCDEVLRVQGSRIPGCRAGS